MNGDTPQAPDGGNWQYKPEDEGPETDAPQQFQPTPEATVPQPTRSAQAEVNWTASEFIAHDKSSTWYMVLAAVIVVLMALSYFLFHDVIATISIVFLGVIFGALASHKPRVLEYRIDPSGVHIGPKVYQYDQFKSFGVVREGAFSNVTLMPLRRFSPSLTVYYPPEDEEAIVNAMADYLPMADVPNDAIDRFLRTIHF
ncbi:MAG TPA: hypothetical protein VJ843_05845 [Candidatus Saccharimonadales bacterium]|nr:hypothetical protein [Candidatus Saccharimonadales bacterium]